MKYKEREDFRVKAYRSPWYSVGLSRTVYPTHSHGTGSRPGGTESKNLDPGQVSFGAEFITEHSVSNFILFNFISFHLNFWFMVVTL